MLFWVVIGVLSLGLMVDIVFVLCCHINPRDDGD